MQSKKLTIKTQEGGFYTIAITYAYTGTATFTPDVTTYLQHLSEENNWSIYDEWNDWFHNGTLPTEKEEEKKAKHCWHDWKEYNGFTEHYWYCEKCDAKSEENPNKCF